MNKKIIITTTSLFPGGAEYNLVRLVKRLNEFGFDITVVVLKRTEQSLSDQLVRYCTILQTNSIFGFSLLKNLRSSNFLFIGWMYHGNVAAALLGIVFNKKFVFNIRQSFSSWKNETVATRICIFLNMFLMRLAKATVFNSHAGLYSHQRLIGFDSSKAKVVSNFFYNHDNKKRFYKDWFRRSDKLVCAIIGRDHPMKGYDVLSAAFEREEFSDVISSVLIFGDVKNRGQFSFRNGKFMGRFPQSELWDKVIAEVDLVLCPSQWGEGRSNVLVESWLAGVPCFATRVGDNALYLSDFFLVDFDLGDLIWKIRHLAANDHNSRKLISDQIKYISEKVSADSDDLVRFLNACY